MGSPRIARAHSVERAFAILEFLGETQRRCNISEIGRRLGIPKSTAHILVLTLERLGYVVREPGRREYKARVRFYGATHLQGRTPWLPERVLPQLEELARKTNLTAHLAVRDEGQALYVQKAAAPGTVGFDTFVGKRTNLHCTAVGKVILAYSGEAAVRDFLSKGRFARHTPNTITSAEALRLEVAKVLQNGFALDDEEEEIGVRCVAVPVYDLRNRFVASLGLAGTAEQIERSELRKIVMLARATARRVGAACIHQEPPAE